MDTVKVSKQTLLDKIETNRANHRAIFEEALEGYRARVLQILEDHIARVKNNKPEKISIAIPFPEDHTRDYDTIIAMLRMSLDEKIELSDYDFKAYVLDDWSWKHQFLTSNSYYSASAANALESI